jgi:putative ATPase
MTDSPTMPLASKLRPLKLDDFIGQERLVGENGPIRKLITAGKIPSMIFWGPPASGKTSLAEIIAHSVDAEFLRISAVTDGKDALRMVIRSAEANQLIGRQTILFIDEIHRWNKAQQDALLPYVEKGNITLIGATTENPSFTVISALLSRSRVFVFDQHTEDNILIALRHGAELLGVKADEDALVLLSNLSNGDMRFALNSLEIAADLSDGKPVSKEYIENAIQKFLRYDKNGEEHYNLISAVHKSLRSSNPTAAVYWVMRILQAGEDPLYIARRLVRFASEDIGNANPNALLIANLTFDTCQKLGVPECDVALVQCAEYLANSKKDNSAYTAATQAKEDIKRFGNLSVPLHLRNAPTSLMKDLDYGKGYQYDHDVPGKKSGQQCLPDELIHRNYFGEALSS